MSKRVPTHTTEQGPPEYWRSLDHLAERPEIKAQIEREFPEGASTIVNDATTAWADHRGLPWLTILSQHIDGATFQLSRK